MCVIRCHYGRSKIFSTNEGLKSAKRLCVPTETHSVRCSQRKSKRSVLLRIEIGFNGAGVLMRFLRKAMKRFGRPETIVTDKLRSYRAATKVIGNEARQETGHHLNNRAENSHQPFRQQVHAMARCRSSKSLQKSSSIHASVHNHFNKERHLCSSQFFKNNRFAALAEWRQLAA
jgi:hypothetical protein